MKVQVSSCEWVGLSSSIAERLFAKIACSLNSEFAEWILTEHPDPFYVREFPIINIYKTRIYRNVVQGNFQVICHKYL